MSQLEKFRTVVVGDHELKIREFNGVRVIPMEAIDTLHKKKGATKKAKTVTKSEAGKKTGTTTKKATTKKTGTTTKKKSTTKSSATKKMLETVKKVAKKE